MLFKHFLALLCVMLGWLPAIAPAYAAQGNHLQLQVSVKRLALDEELQVQLRASGEYDEMTALSPDGFDFREAGRQNSVNIVNGSVDRSEVFTFVGTPKRAGKFVLGPVELRSDGRVVARSESVEIEVVSQDAANMPAQSVAQATDLQRHAGEPVFIHPVLSLSSPFVGQPFVITYEVYWSQRIGLRAIRQTTQPKWGNLDIEDLQPKGSPQEQVNFGGRAYVRQSTQKMLLTAATPGKIRIEGPAFRVEIGDVFETRASKVLTPPIELEVRTIPALGRPSSFVVGNVGSLKLNGSLSAGGKTGGGLTAQVGERLLLDYTVTGEGNLLGLKAIIPPAQANMAVDALPARADEGVEHTDAGLRGSRTWKSVISFDKPGVYTVAAVEWTSFDPVAERFETSTVGPFQVTIVGEATAQVAAAKVEGDGVTPKAVAAQADPFANLSPIAAQARLAETQRTPWARLRFAWLIALLPWLGALLVLLVLRVRVWRARRLPALKRASALGDAAAGLAGVASIGPDRGFAAIRDAIGAYLQRAFSVQLAGLTEQSLRQQLDRCGVDPADAEQLAIELQHCDFARFAPGGDRDGDLAATAARVRVVLERVELAAGKKTGASPVALSLLVIFGFSAFCSAGATAATLDDAFTSGNRSYLAHDYAAAKKAYESLLMHDVRSVAIQYNLGNTLVRLGQPGRAIGRYKAAQRLAPTPELADSIRNNLTMVRAELSDRARRNHATLHIFDESPELDVAIARAAPQNVLIILGIIAGFAALLLFGLRCLSADARHRTGGRLALLLSCATVHVIALVWLWQAQVTEAEVVHAVVIEEDAALTTCQGASETIGLPEGLEVRKVAELADGRLEVRLPNGQQGCMSMSSLELAQ